MPAPRPARPPRPVHLDPALRRSDRRRGNGRDPVLERHARRFPLALVALLVVGISLSVTPVVTAGVSAADDPSDKRPPASKIDLNQATPEQLQTIPGIGPSLAQRIVDFRAKQGPFRRVEDLLKIKGIGEKSFQKLRGYVKVTPAA